MTVDASIAAQTLLEQIDAQQNELLDELDALNARIEQVLKANSSCFGIVSAPTSQAGALMG
jgi:hypothetical protein